MKANLVIMGAFMLGTIFGALLMFGAAFGAAWRVNQGLQPRAPKVAKDRRPKADIGSEDRAYSQPTAEEGIVGATRSMVDRVTAGLMEKEGLPEEVARQVAVEGLYREGLGEGF